MIGLHLLEGGFGAVGQLDRRRHERRALEAAEERHPFAEPGNLPDALEILLGAHVVPVERRVRLHGLGARRVRRLHGVHGVDAQRIQDALATSNNIGVENNVPQGGVVWVFAVKK